MRNWAFWNRRKTNFYGPWENWHRCLSSLRGASHRNAVTAWEKNLSRPKRKSDQSQWFQCKQQFGKDLNHVSNKHSTSEDFSCLDSVHLYVEPRQGNLNSYQLGAPPALEYEHLSRTAKYAGALQLETCAKLCEGGQVNEAFEALDVLVKQGAPVDSTIFYRVLKSCIAHDDGELGSRLHALAVKSGLETNPFVVNHIIRMYASCGKLEEATDVFTKFASPDIFMWTSIIKAYSENGQPRQALALYGQMRKSSVTLNKYALVAALNACAKAIDLTSGKQIHADFLGSDVELADVFVGNCLMDMYAKCGSLEDARHVFDNMPTRDVVTWTTLIAAYVQHGQSHEALSLYASMQQNKMSLANNVTFVCLLRACATERALDQGQELHAEILRKGLEDDVKIAGCLVDMYAKCGNLEDARRVFDRMPVRDLVTSNVMITAYVKCGNVENARRLFDRLQTKDVVTWTAMIAGYAEHARCQEALNLYARMQQDGKIVADSVLFSCLLGACATMGCLQQAKQLHSQIQRSGLERDIVVGNCILDMYVKCGSLKDAREVFDRLPGRDTSTWNAMIGGYAKAGNLDEACKLFERQPAKDVVTWTTMISGYAEHGLCREAIDLYMRMDQGGGAEADAVTFRCLLKACGSLGALQLGMQLHEKIKERGLETHLDISNCMVDMYAKCGRIADAHRVLRNISSRDVVTWNALLNGYADHSDGQMAVQCFAEMQEHGVEPNHATFTCLLAACSHAGLVSEGQMFFGMMTEHGLTPNVQHYNCLVDLLARSGQLDEAESVLQTMPFENDLVGWTSLLSACKSHGDIQRGLRCFNQLVQLEPEYGSAYLLLGSIYAEAGMWRDVDRIESLRKSAGAKKKPAKATIEVKNSVHEFTVGEERADVSSKLTSVNLKLKKEGGHVPQTQLVLKAVPEVEKEDALCGHAEKLALAYGLLHTPDGETLLVTKNLRMCSDCHSGTKIMSRLEKREIIVRDSHRVHHFVDGSCSCGDRC